MVHIINEQEVEVHIIPKLIPSLDTCNIDLNDGDTLVLTVDPDIWDIDTAQEFFKLFQSVFPRNKIMIVYKGIEIGVIHQHE